MAKVKVTEIEYEEDIVTEPRFEDLAIALKVFGVAFGTIIATGLTALGAATAYEESCKKKEGLK